MEKRLIIAFFASFVFITTWNLIFKQSKPREAPPALVESVPSPVKSIARSSLLVPEQIFYLENPFVKVKLTNLGGGIKEVYIKNHGASLPVTNILFDSANSLDTYEVEQRTGTQITFMRKTRDTQYRKRFTFSNEYSLVVDIEVANLSNLDQKIALKTEGFILDISRVDKSVAAGRDRGLFEYSISSKEGIFRKDNAFSFTQKKDGRSEKNINWFAFRDKYFCVIVKPLFSNSFVDAQPVADNKLLMLSGAEEFTVAANEHKTYKYLLFYGPQKNELLLQEKQEFEKIWVFSRYPFLDFIAKAISKLLTIFHNFVPNFGVCVIFISFSIYLLLYPLTVQSSSSMRKMQLLQPKINDLREKFKDNPQRMNKEVLELYKEKKVNPFSGCLPLFLQMPIFISLYQVLWRSVSLKGESFLWIKDLAEPDRLFVFSANFPVIGNEFNILPIVIAVFLFLQQKITSKNIVTSDPTQAMQQKMMLVFMPIFLGFVFYKFPSGLSIYFTVFYLLSTITQWKMSRLIKA